MNDSSKSIKCSVFIATSLDGFIARRDGGLDWLPGSDGSATGEDYGYHDFFASVDSIVFGRKTYELASSFKEWPYRGKKVFVLSSGFPKAPTNVREDVAGTSATPAELLKHVAGLGCKHVYVDGGKTIQSFLREGLIDELTLTRIPVLIGEGIPLFGALPHDIQLQHVATKGYPSGFVQSKYQVIRAS